MFCFRNIIFYILRLFIKLASDQYDYGLKVKGGSIWPPSHWICLVLVGLFFFCLISLNI